MASTPHPRRFRSFSLRTLMVLVACVFFGSWFAWNVNERAALRHSFGVIDESLREVDPQFDRTNRNIDRLRGAIFELDDRLKKTEAALESAHRRLSALDQTPIASRLESPVDFVILTSHLQKERDGEFVTVRLIGRHAVDDLKVRAAHYSKPEFTDRMAAIANLLAWDVVSLTSLEAMGEKSGASFPSTESVWAECSFVLSHGRGEEASKMRNALDPYTVSSRSLGARLTVPLTLSRALAAGPAEGLGNGDFEDRKLLHLFESPE